MRPEYSGDVDAFTDAPRYVVDAAFDPGPPARLAGHQRVRYTNMEAGPIPDVYFNLYVNTAQFLGRIELREIRVGGRPVKPERLYENTVIRIPLERPLGPGETLDIEMDWSESISPGMEGEFARYGISRGVYSLVSFVPLLAHREDGEWVVRDQAFTGDPVTSDTGLFLLHITAPEGFATVASGAAIAEVSNGDGTRTLTFASGPMRDVALIIGPLEQHRLTVGGITVNLWLLPEHSPRAGRLLKIAEDSLVAFEEFIGPYPFNEIDYVDVAGFGGIEFPGLVILGTVEDDLFSEVVVAHETGHQWFYSLLGDDQLNEPWLDEGITSYLEVVYFGAVYGPQRGQEALDEHTQTWTNFASDPDLPIGLSVEEYRSEGDYFTITYSKSVTFLDELRRTMGDEAFNALFPALYNRYKYGFLNTSDFHEQAEAACSCELDELFSLWVTHGGEVNLGVTPARNP